MGDPATGGGRSARTDAVAALFCSEQVPVRIEVCDDIRAAVFDKLLINASLNTISSLTHTDCGQVVGDPQLRALLTAMVAEVEQVAAALDPPPSLQWSAAKIVEIYTGQFGLRTSMMQDLQARRELERAGIVVSAPTLAADAWQRDCCLTHRGLAVCATLATLSGARCAQDALVELGAAVGVETPLLQAGSALLTAVDATTRGLPGFGGAPLGG